ncbi:unnamed protein product [Discosporangium mesarthrocarpum]
MASSRRGDLLAATSSDGVVRVWCLPSSDELCTDPGGALRVRAFFLLLVRRREACFNPNPDPDPDPDPDPVLAPLPLCFFSLRCRRRRAPWLTVAWAREHASSGRTSPRLEQCDFRAEDEDRVRANFLPPFGISYQGASLVLA